MFVDKLGVVAEPMGLPVRVVLPQYRRRRRRNNTTSPLAEASATPPASPAPLRDSDASPARGSSDDPQAEFGVSIGLHRSSTTARHPRIEQTELAAHLSALKPLGLNVLLERACRRPPSALRRLVPRHLQMTHRMYHQCLCMLGRDIGFTDAALQPFTPVRALFTSFSSDRSERAASASAAAATSGLSFSRNAARYVYRMVAPPGDYGRAPPAMVSLAVQQSVNCGGRRRVLTASNPYTLAAERCVAASVARQCHWCAGSLSKSLRRSLGRLSLLCGFFSC